MAVEIAFLSLATLSVYVVNEALPVEEEKEEEEKEKKKKKDQLPI